MGVAVNEGGLGGIVMGGGLDDGVGMFSPGDDRESLAISVGRGVSVGGGAGSTVEAVGIAAVASSAEDTCVFEVLELSKDVVLEVPVLGGVPVGVVWLSLTSVLTDPPSGAGCMAGGFPRMVIECEEVECAPLSEVAIP